MASLHAQRFNSKARPQLWAQHEEVVELVIGSALPQELTGVWTTVEADAKSLDGAGASTYTGECTFIVTVASLPEAPGPTAEIRRNGQKWSIRHMQRNDEYTWKLYLGRPDQEERMPVRIRR